MTTGNIYRTDNIYRSPFIGKKSKGPAMCRN